MTSAAPLLSLFLRCAVLYLCRRRLQQNNVSSFLSHSRASITAAFLAQVSVALCAETKVLIAHALCQTIVATVYH